MVREKLKVGIVIPTYKKELWYKFVTAWNWESDKYYLNLYIVEDNPKKSFLDLPKPLGSIYINHYCWKDIDKDLKDKAWIISRKSSAIRSYGYYKAYQDGCEYVLTIDDDCYPEKEDYNKIEQLIFNHKAFAMDLHHEYSNTYNVGKQLFPTSGNLWMRGSPIRYRKGRGALVSVGGWNNNPDLDAWTQLENQEPKLKVEPSVKNVPKYSGVTMCGMNVLFHRSVIPIAYFLLQGVAWGVDRVDDIWAGLFIKKVLDVYDKPMAINGFASINHERASNAFVSLKKEGLTLLETELLWDRLIPLKLDNTCPLKTYNSLAEQLQPEWLGTKEYGLKLKEAMKIWVGLFR